MIRALVHFVSSLLTVGVPSAALALAWAGALDPWMAAGATLAAASLAVARWRIATLEPPLVVDDLPAPFDEPTEDEIVHADQVESVGLLAGGIAHDFNNLLTGILGNTQVALRELPEGSARAAVVDAEKAARRARELVAQLLAYSGRGALEKRPIDLPAMVQETRTLLGRVLSPRAQLDIHGRPDLLIEGDPAQIRQVVMNLLTNASDALGGGEGQILVRIVPERLSRRDLTATLLGHELTPGRYIRLEVRDTGCGMDEPTVQRMFEPYYTTKSNGRGLGLAALLGIVRRHGGTVAVDSAPGHGTKVIVWFPAPSVALSVVASDPGSFSRTIERSGRILLAEDEELVRRVAARMLTTLGYEVVAVSDGEEACAAVDRHPDLALALVDVQMPRMDGRQVLRRLRQRRPDVPVILMTGYAGEDAATDNPPDAWLRKPFTVKEMTAALDAARPSVTAA